jgi:hypothetical protein
MIARVGYGLALLLLLAAAFGTGGQPAGAEPRSGPTSLEDVPVQAPPKISPWPEISDQKPSDQQPKDAAGPQSQEMADDPPAAENQTAATSEVADIANLDIDWSLLDVDASTLMTARPVRLHHLAGQAPAGEMSWSSQEKVFGSAVSVKRPLSPFLDTQVGADMTIVRQPATLAELLAEKAVNGGNEPQSSGTAWASVSAPGVASIWDKTTVEARIDPAQDQGKLGTSLSKSLMLSEQYSLTLQNGYSMTQGFAPLPGSAGRTTYGTDQTAKFGITDTGTSFSAGQSLSTTDDKWLRKIGAEQKIIGSFNISTSIAETPLGIPNKRVSAGFRQSW